MNMTLAKSLLALVPVSILLVGAIVLFLKVGTAASALQLVGAASLMMVVLTHVAEATDTLPVMQWGLADSPGHYLDLSSLILGFILFPTGYLWQALVVPRSPKH